MYSYWHDHSQLLITFYTVNFEDRMLKMTIYIYIHDCSLDSIKMTMYADWHDHSLKERWGAGVETQKNVRQEIGGWGRVPFNEPYAPLLSTIYDGA